MYGYPLFTQTKSGYIKQPIPADEILFHHRGYGSKPQHHPNNMIADSIPPMRPLQVYSPQPPHPLSLDDDKFTAPRTGAGTLTETSKSHNLPQRRKRRIKSLDSDKKASKSRKSSLKRPNLRSKNSSDSSKEGRKTSKKRSQNKKEGSRTKVSEEDIWSDDVQIAFEEALALAPKQGMYKVKLEEKSIGRNGLISSYILYKTGKFRSRKQVSSHIQVVKNLGKDKSLIEYINRGPTFETPEDEEKHKRKFFKEFKAIFADKSFWIQLPENNVLSPTPELTPSSEPDRQTDFRLAKFEFLMNSYEFGSVPLSALGCSPQVAFNPFAMITNFPGIESHFANSAPIIHNKIKICSDLYVPGSELRAAFQIISSNPSPRLNCFTKVMSRGYEVLRTNEKDFTINAECDFLPSFWQCLFEKSNPQTAPLALTLLGITVEQILYEPMDSDGTFILKKSIRAVILWEFEIVGRPAEAATISNVVQLPLQFPKQEGVIHGQDILPASPCNSFSSDSSRLDLIHTGMQAVSSHIESDVTLENTYAPPLYPPSFSTNPSSQIFPNSEGVLYCDYVPPSVNFNLDAGIENEYTIRTYGR